MDENKLKIAYTENHGRTYWSYNCPLQMWPEHKDPENEYSEIIGWRVLNYMPRKEACRDLEETISPDELKTYCDNAAKVLRNLSNRFEMLGKRKIDTIYYADETEED